MRGRGQGDSVRRQFAVYFLPMPKLARAPVSPAAITDLDRRLTDPEVQSSLTVDQKMVQAIRTLARGEPLIDYLILRDRASHWKAELTEVGIKPTQADPILDLLESAFRLGASSSVRPVEVIRAFETIVKLGHTKLWEPVKSSSEPRSVTINILSIGGKGVAPGPEGVEIPVNGGPKLIEAKVEAGGLDRG